MEVATKQDLLELEERIMKRFDTAFLKMYQYMDGRFEKEKREHEKFWDEIRKMHTSQDEHRKVLDHHSIELAAQSTLLDRHASKINRNSKALGIKADL